MGFSNEKFSFEENKSVIIHIAVGHTAQNCYQWPEVSPLFFRVIHLGKARSLISSQKTIPEQVSIKKSWRYFKEILV